MSDSLEDFKKFCSNLRCLVCDAPLYGDVQFDIANLYCTNNFEEYSCTYTNIFSEVLLQEHTQIRFANKAYKYEIDSKLMRQETGYYRTIIYQTLDCYDKNRKSLKRNRIFNCAGTRFLNLLKIKEEKEFVNKLKLYNTFS